jgi:glycosyltransferase involved in cell wall biosynthesis
MLLVGEMAFDFFAFFALRFGIEFLLMAIKFMMIQNNVSEKYNILQILPFLHLGAGRGVLSLSKKLVKRGHRVVIVGSGKVRNFAPDQALIAEAENSGIKYYELNVFARSPIRVFQAAKVIAQIIMADGINIIHAHAGIPTLVGVLARRFSKRALPILSTVHGWGLRKKWYQKRMDVFALNRSDLVIALSAEIENNMIREGVTPKKLTLLPNAIDLERFSNLNLEDEKMREEFGVYKGEFLVGSISHLIKRKGINYFIEAIPMVLNEISNVRFLIVGEGEEREELERLVTKLGIRESVVFTGFHRDIPHLLSILDVVVIPSLSDALPRVALEAMAMRKPIIATENLGIPEGVGIFVRKESAEELALAILNLLKNRESAVKFGTKGRKLVEDEFNMERRVDRLEGIYRLLRGA